MMDVKILFLLLLFCSVSSSVKHHLRYFFIASHGVQDLPEFVAIGMVNEVPLGYWDSNMTEPEPKSEWAKQLVKDDPEHLKWHTSKCVENKKNLGKKIVDTMQRLNQSGGVHIFQRMEGCDWDNETGERDGFDQYGYDGEDFITFDLQSLTWIAPNQLAVATKRKWDSDVTRLQRDKDFYIRKCPGLLMKYLNNQSSLQRTEHPSVSLLQKTSSSPITCHATGFYPNNAALFWRKDGEELQEEADRGEILPNPDGTFQMSAHLTLPSESSSDWGRYECVFQLSGGKEDMVTKLDKAAIRSNEVTSAGPVVGVAVGLPFLSVCIVGLLIWRRNNNGCQQANNKQSEPEEEAVLDEVTV